MPAHFQQSVLQRLIPMLVVLSIVAALPSICVRSGAKEPTSPNDIDQRELAVTAGPENPPDNPLEYEYAYGVQDSTTGDHKDQWERRVGDTVKGVYMFEEADGTQRIVEYEADDERGFRAIVTNVDLRKGPEQHGDQRRTVAHSYNMLRAAKRLVEESHALAGVFEDASEARTGVRNLPTERNSAGSEVNLGRAKE
uniref:Uncharacterized protein n=1 Tax=Anopheles atroparvus TaxID=41427 RepID=A0A182IU47_ANOAO